MGLFYSLYKYTTLTSKEEKNVSYVEFRGNRMSETYKSVLRAQEETRVRLARRAKRLAQQKLDAQVQRVLRRNITDYVKVSGETSSEEFDGGGESGQRVGSKYYNRLWQQIRAHVSYREEHRLLRLTGNVQITVRVDEHGKLIRILRETAHGDHRLVGWVILCLIEALKEPVPELVMDSKKVFELHFYFSMGEKTLVIPYSNNRMFFSIVGENSEGLFNMLSRGEMPKQVLTTNSDASQITVGLLTIPTDRIWNLFKKKKINNNIEENFYEKEEKYKHHCEKAYNPDACGLVAKLYESIGDMNAAKKFRGMEKKWLAREQEMAAKNVHIESQVAR